MASHSLMVSELFYSIQGEGKWVGTPAVFLRLTGCDFRCSWCDTVAVWRKGKRFLTGDLIDRFEKEGYSAHLKKGAHLVVTGGNPLLQEDVLDEFLTNLSLDIGSFIITEIETQGNIVPTIRDSLVDWWNVSPKLSNSGVPFEKRVVVKALQDLANRVNVSFKFPVQCEADLKEVQCIVNVSGIEPTEVYLMPVCATRLEHNNLAPQVVNWCKDLGYNFSPRLQLVIWDKTCGV